MKVRRRCQYARRSTKPGSYSSENEAMYKSLIALSVLFLQMTVPLAGAAEPLPKCSTPAECFDAIHACKQKKDFPGMLSCMTEAAQCYLAGEIAYQLEHRAFLRMTKGQEAEAILEKYGVNDLDIVGQMQILSGRRSDPYRAWLWAGAWIEKPADFLKEGTQLMEAAAEEEAKAIPKELEKTRKKFAELKKAAKSDDEKEQIQEQEKANIDALEQALERNAAQTKEAAEGRKETLEKIQIKEAAATASVAGTVRELHFRKVEGRWLLATESKEAKVERPTKRERIINRLAMRGSLENDYELAGEGNDKELNSFRYRGDRETPRLLADTDLKTLATLDSIGAIILEDAAAVTDEGISSLAALKNLQKLRLANLSTTAAILETVAKFKNLRRLELNNINFSDESLQAFKKTLPRCQITESYDIHFTRFEKPFEEARDKKRVTMVMLAEFPIPLSPQDDNIGGPETKKLFRLIRNKNVQLLGEVRSLTPKMKPSGRVAPISSRR
jgi:hypothetical protein